jgi:hypothetical protein
MFEACMKFACVLTIRLMGGDSVQSPNGSMKTRSLMKEVLVVEASKLSPNFPEKKMLEAELLNQVGANFYSCFPFSHGNKLMPVLFL